MIRTDASLARRDYPGIGCLHFDRLAGGEVQFIYREVVVDGDYLKHGITIAPGDVVFDVGANIGIFSLHADRLCGGRLTLYAFEPIPRSFEILELNAEEHGLRGRPGVRLFNLGLTRRDGPRTVEFAYYPRLPGNSTLDPERNVRLIDTYFSRQGRRHPWLFPLLKPWLRRLASRYYTPLKVTCRMTTLSEICASYPVPRIDLLKIDVEGGEMEVLDGIDASDWPRIRQIALEAHDIDGRIARLQSMLMERGYQVTAEQPEWARSARLDNYHVFARRGEALPSSATI